MLDDTPTRFRNRWSRGEPLLPVDGYIAFDARTTGSDPASKGLDLVFAVASAGAEFAVVIHPDDLGHFVSAHRHVRWICFNAASVFWIVEQYLRARAETTAIEAWWQIAGADRLHDLVLLDALVGLAIDGAGLRLRTPVTICREVAGLKVVEDQHQSRCGNLVNTDWSQIETAFFESARSDVHAIRPAYLSLRKAAIALARDSAKNLNDTHSDARHRFGLLTEAVQVKKAIALAAITRNGMHVDQIGLPTAKANCSSLIDGAVQRLGVSCPNLLKVDDHGELSLTGAARTPTCRDDVLLSRLEQTATNLGIGSAMPRSKGGEISKKREDWLEYRKRDPFIRDWLDLVDGTSRLRFLAQLRGCVVHPIYTVMNCTGRTSCTDPPVQQTPQEHSIRRLFVASPGHVLLSVDFKFIELVALAAICMKRYGQSTLAEVICGGGDPHVHTAAMMLGVSVSDFQSWETGNTEFRERFRTGRQAAKAVNFGIAGARGPAGIRDDAEKKYGVRLSLDEAQQWLETLKREIYPELGRYLDQDGSTILARGLHASVTDVRAELGEFSLDAIQETLAGETSRNRLFISRVWSSLSGLNQNPDLIADLTARKPSRRLPGITESVARIILSTWQWLRSVLTISAF